MDRAGVSMFSTAKHVLAISVICFGGTAFGVDRPAHEKYRDTYEKKLASINREHSSAVTNIEKHYLVALGRLAKRAQERGELNSVMATRKESVTGKPGFGM